MNFDDYDLERGFVLRYDKAVQFLDSVAIAHAKAVMTGEEDSEGMTELLEDLREMRKEIDMGKSEYVKFVECPMAPSNINYIELIEKGE